MGFTSSMLPTMATVALVRDAMSLVLLAATAGKKPLPASISTTTFSPM